MNENNMYEDWEIDVKGLLFVVLYRWRSIIIVALILGILLGGYKVTSGILMRQDPSELVDQEEIYQKDMELYQQTLAGYERDIASLESRLEDQQIYMNDWMIMDGSSIRRLWKWIQRMVLCVRISQISSSG